MQNNKVYKKIKNVTKLYFKTFIGKKNFVNFGETKSLITYILNLLRLSQNYNDC